MVLLLGGDNKMTYFNIRTPSEFTAEMERHDAVMSEPYMQTAFRLLCDAADVEYKTLVGAGNFVEDVVDTAIMSRRVGWRKDYRARLLDRSLQRPKCRAAMNAFIAFYMSTVNEKFDWKGDRKNA
jgi:hypothetical protein